MPTDDRLFDGAEKALPEIARFRDSLVPETDRGAALMAVAYLDAQLLTLLERHFVDDPEVTKEILGQSRPLGSFSARIDLAYLLGHIGRDVRRELHLIRKIRNEFGHDFLPLDFKSEPIAQRCRSLKLFGAMSGIATRDLFVNSVCLVLGAIHGASDYARRPMILGDIEITEQALNTALRVILRRGIWPSEKLE